ncbi:hypothetical protein [Helicobacter sp. WB40]|uniref:hypothetical protein n=1 Tax=Helicobacter sp. WB40 TaxID=3004130 RepID=UPI0022EC00FC|nr:hypothetical protein [Helicobacter sp. WB40]MDA3967738.1 hypothetical protein [Helicobacter sp. WB40]
MVVLFKIHAKGLLWNISKAFKGIYATVMMSDKPMSQSEILSLIKQQESRFLIYSKEKQDEKLQKEESKANSTKESKEANDEVGVDENVETKLPKGNDSAGLELTA